MSSILINSGVNNYGGVPLIGANTAANRPTARIRGRLFVDTTNNLLQYDTGTAWVNIGSAGPSGSGAAGQATFWTGSSTISGDNAFFWDNTNKRLGLGTTTPGVRLDAHGTGVIAQLNGTTTNNAYLDFQNAGTTRIRIGNDYNGGAQTFAILNNTTSNYFAFGVQSNGRMGFNSPNLSLLGAAQFEFYSFTTLTTFGNFIFTNDNTAAFYNTYKTRSTTKGSYSATLNGDNLGAFAVAGSTNSGYVGAGVINFVQNGAVGTTAPTDVLIRAHNNSGVLTARLQMVTTGYSTFADRLNVNNATDNALFELNVNGNTYTGGLSPTILTVGTNTTMARTATGYYCTATLTLTLPSAASLNNVYWVIAGPGATITVNRAGTDDILNLAGASVTSITISPNQRAMFYVGGGTRTFLIFQA